MANVNTTLLFAFIYKYYNGVSKCKHTIAIGQLITPGLAMNPFQTLFYFNSSVDISWLPTFEQLRSFFIIVFSDAEDN